MHLFDDCDDRSSCGFRQLYPRRNQCSLIFIFAIIDSEGLTNNCLDFFALPCCVVVQKISHQRNRRRWVFLKMAFLVSSKQQGSLFPSHALELISILTEGIFNMSAPCKAALPCWSVAHTCASSTLLPLFLLRKRLWGTEVLIDWQLSPHDASIIIISTLAEGRGLRPGGLADSPCFVSPIVN